MPRIIAAVLALAVIGAACTLDNDPTVDVTAESSVPGATEPGAVTGTTLVLPTTELEDNRTPVLESPEGAAEIP